MSLTEWAFGRLIIVIVATAAVTAIGAGGIGYVAGRHSSDSGPKTPADSEPVPEQSAEDAPETPAVAVSPTSEVPVAASDGPVGGPTRVNEFGVPVGYPHTEAGAISACGNYIAITSVAKNREQSRSRDVIMSISDEATAARLSKLLTDIDTETARNFGVPSILAPQFLMNHRVFGYRISDHRENESRIEILSAIGAGIVDGPPNLRPSMHWGTDVCTINWDGSDWKLRDVSGGGEGHAMTERSSESFERFALAGVTS